VYPFETGTATRGRFTTTRERACHFYSLDVGPRSHATPPPPPPLLLLNADGAALGSSLINNQLLDPETCPRWLRTLFLFLFGFLLLSDFQSTKTFPFRNQSQSNVVY